MKIILTPFGSTGDVQPLLALGIALKQNGHEILVLSSPNYEKIFCENGLTFYSAGFDIQSTMEQYSKEIYGNPFKLIKTFKQIYRNLIIDQYNQLISIAENGTELILGSGLSIASKSVTEKLKIPYHHVCYYPNVYPSRYNPPTFISYQRFPNWINSFFWKCQNFILKKLFGENLNLLRKEQGLPKIIDFANHINENSILACNKSLITVPNDVKTKFIHTSYLFIENQIKLDDKILNFISKSNKTIYIGFGSMTDSNPKKSIKLLKELSNLTEYNFIISKGWAKFNIETHSDNILFIDYVPFLTLFPKMSIVIHHGGAGTTLSAAQSGVPQVIVPHMIDQYYWGKLISDLKIGSNPIKRSALNLHNLKKSIDYIFTNSEITENAKRIGFEMRKENGLKNTISYIENE